MAAEAELRGAGRFRLEFNFPLLTLRTQLLSGVFDRLGASHATRYLSWAALATVPVAACIGLYLVFESAFALLRNPEAGELIRSVGPGAYLLLPGVNPFLPLLYGWFAIFCAVVVHEGAHGVIARSLGLRVNSSGLLFLLFVPVGAFVDVDEGQLKASKADVSSRVLAAGIGANLVVAVVCLLGVLLVLGGLEPVVDGVYVSEVLPGMPAEAAGLLPGDVLVSFDGTRLNSTAEMRSLLDKKSPGDVVEITVARGEMWQDLFKTYVNLTAVGNRTVIGVRASDLLAEERLNYYHTVSFGSLSVYLVPPALAPGLVPFSDSLSPFFSHRLGPQWHVFANALFWLWFVNFNVAVFNALPIYPMDGGRMFNIALENVRALRGRGKLISRITAAVAAVLVVALLTVVIAPFAIR